MPRGLFSRILPAVESNTSPHTPAHIPYPSLECVLSISLRVPSWAGGACRVLPLCRACWHMPVIGTQRVTDFPPAWGEVRVCLQALVAPEVVCAERVCDTRSREEDSPRCSEEPTALPSSERVLRWPLGAWLGARAGRGAWQGTWRGASKAAAVADPSAGNCLAGSRGDSGTPAGHRGQGQPGPAGPGTLRGTQAHSRLAATGPVVPRPGKGSGPTPGSGQRIVPRECSRRVR